jgi:hypothetical protein
VLPFHRRISAVGRLAGPVWPTAHALPADVAATPLRALLPRASEAPRRSPCDLRNTHVTPPPDDNEPAESGGTHVRAQAADLSITDGKCLAGEKRL